MRAVFLTWEEWPFSPPVWEGQSSHLLKVMEVGMIARTRINQVWKSCCGNVGTSAWNIYILPVHAHAYMCAHAGTHLHILSNSTFPDQVRQNASRGPRPQLQDYSATQVCATSCFVSYTFTKIIPFEIPPSQQPHLPMSSTYKPHNPVRCGWICHLSGIRGPLASTLCRPHVSEHSPGKGHSSCGKPPQALASQILMLSLLWPRLPSAKLLCWVTV